MNGFLTQAPLKIFAEDNLLKERKIIKEGSVMFKGFSKSLFVLLLVLSAVWGMAFASARAINIQGKLTDATTSYNPLNGGKFVKFSLYDSTAAVTPVWHGTEWVLFDKGLFNVAITSKDVSFDIPDLDSLPFDKQYYLGIKVGGDNEEAPFDNEMLPRQMLSATPYAMGSLGDFQVARNFKINGSLNGDLTATDNVSVGKNLNVSSNSIISGNLSVAGNSTIAGSFSMLGNIGIGTSSPTAKIETKASGSGNMDIIRVTNNNGYFLSNLGKTSESAYFTLRDSGNTDKILLSANGSSILNGGNVGIGTTSPATKLETKAYGSGDMDIVRVTNSNGYTLSNLGKASENGYFTLRDSANADKVMLLANGDSFLNGGKVGIGMTGSDILRALSIRPTADNPQLFLAQSNNPAGGWEFHADTNGNLVVYSKQDNEKLIMNMFYNSGGVAINTTYDDPNVKLRVNGNIACGTLYQSSDERLKKDITNYANGHMIDKVIKLRAIKYKFDKEAMQKMESSSSTVQGLAKEEYDNKYSFCDETQIGLSAQELEKEFPELVKTDSRGYKSVNYSGLSVILLEALKEQQIRIDDIEARLKAVESK